MLKGFLIAFGLMAFVVVIYSTTEGHRLNQVTESCVDAKLREYGPFQRGDNQPLVYREFYRQCNGAN